MSPVSAEQLPLRYNGHVDIKVLQLKKEAYLGVLAKHLIIVDGRKCLSCVFSADKGSTGDVECVCEGFSCNGDQHCFGLQCFSSLSVENGMALQHKGCIVGSEEVAVRCKNSQTVDSLVHCCQETLCNMNVTVEMPSTGESLKQ